MPWEELFYLLLSASWAFILFSYVKNKKDLFSSENFIKSLYIGLTDCVIKNKKFIVSLYELCWMDSPPFLVITVSSIIFMQLNSNLLKITLLLPFTKITIIIKYRFTYLLAMRTKKSQKCESTRSINYIYFTCTL